MENPEEILHSLEEFSKMRPKDIPHELEEYLCFVAKTGDPIYQWPAIKSLFREKMLNVITEFYEACPSMDIPPCPNVDLFNYDVMKNFILEKLDTFAAAPFTVQRICELLTTPRKEYNRIDKYMRALEKNVLVVSTTEPGGRRGTENGDGIMNGLESEHLPETSNSSNDINVEEMDEASSAWPSRLALQSSQGDAFSVVTFSSDTETTISTTRSVVVQETVVSASAKMIVDVACTSSQDTVITCRAAEEPYVSIEPVPSNACSTARQQQQDNSVDGSDISVTITAIPATVQKRRSSIEPVVSSDENQTSQSDDNNDTVSTNTEVKDADSSSSSSSSSTADEDIIDGGKKVEEAAQPEAVSTYNVTVDDEALPLPVVTVPVALIEPDVPVEEGGDKEEISIISESSCTVVQTTQEVVVLLEGVDDESKNEIVQCSSAELSSISLSGDTETIIEQQNVLIKDVKSAECDDEDSEITSSVTKEIIQVTTTVEGDDSNEKETNEATTSSLCADEDIKVESQATLLLECPETNDNNVVVTETETAIVVSNEIISNAEVIPMEVDDNTTSGDGVNNDEDDNKVDEIIKAEATSDSPL